MFKKIHNRLITLLVGKQPVMMNVDIKLAPGYYEVDGSILCNGNTLVRG